MKPLAGIVSSLLLGAAGSLVFAPTAVAQATSPLTNANPATAPQMNPQGHDAAPTASAPSTNGNAPIAPRARQLPPTVDSGSTPIAARSDSREVFVQLDRAQRGYLAKPDVTSNRYLSRHFKQCDGNHDGRLSREEVDACMAHATPQSN